MATFGKFETTIVPSEFGLEFTAETPVRFTIQNQAETGTVTKQLKNSAVVQINETDLNRDLMVRSNGVMIINYKELQKIS
ncbi:MULTISPECIES: hypothetical protein [Enterococcus]|uniref:Uncharacterized protein n=1 Tax=Enterococcus alcedinis TaxID=1274384 RepID=A0A917JIP3_9ENTE|nr:hypothetical protein [Enterococcus alcedinis]MBP2103110.1 hypothetical protein [Enterococcus alcedinis]GGI66672.1 hypothetical protein GCM10011482_23260 [Enterococcus alcedinis]